jgi:molecular chaperone IbpA|tara:strand:- start:133 stop:555 length:423 start_codon:yes stop_codon:yes gene_type:complete
MTIYDDVFGKSFPFAIGFDRTFQLLNRADHLHDTSNYPPYNIVKIDAENFSVEVAVAGFGKKDISITKEKEVLLIEGKKENLNEDTEYVHRGLSGRTFNRKFTLADDIIVNGADMKDGILSVSLERVVPEEDKPVEIKIK